MSISSATWRPSAHCIGVLTMSSCQWAPIPRRTISPRIATNCSPVRFCFVCRIPFDESGERLSHEGEREVVGHLQPERTQPRGGICYRSELSHRIDSASQQRVTPSQSHVPLLAWPPGLMRFSFGVPPGKCFIVPLNPEPRPVGRRGLKMLSHLGPDRLGVALGHLKVLDAVLVAQQEVRRPTVFEAVAVAVHQAVGAGSLVVTVTDAGHDRAHALEQLLSLRGLRRSSGQGGWTCSSVVSGVSGGGSMI
jgi:hypothetical protein